MVHLSINTFSKLVCKWVCFFIIFCTISQKTFSQGLVGYYPFNGNANDASGNSHHGQLMNGVQLTSDRFGNSNSAYHFDGIDDYIKIIDNGAFSTPKFSLAIWFQSESNALQNLVGKRDYLTSAGTGGAQYQFFINYPPFPGIGSNIVSNTSSCSSISSSSYLNTGNVICSNKWYFAVVTFDGNRHKIYIDGILIRDIPTSFTGMLSCNSELRFGNWWSLDLITFKGKLDDICWYNRPITQHEVDSIFNNFSSPTSLVEFTYSQDACDPLKVSFTNNTAGFQSCVWNFGDATTSASPNPVHTYPVWGSYNVKLITTNTAGCTDSISKPVLVNTVFGITPSFQNTCTGNSFTITATGADTYSWFTSSQNNLSTTNQLVLTATSSDTYFVAVNNSTCNTADTLSAVVNIVQRPVIAIVKSNDIDCTLPQAQLSATGGDSYSWSPSTNITNTNIANPVVNPVTDTWYKVTVTTNGCSGKDSILVKSDLSKGKASFLVPNAFTPNKDGLNDCFGVRYWSPADEFEMSIYNRWGQLVFFTKDKTKCWDGNFKSLQQPSGVFVYQIKAKSPCGSEAVYKKGTLVLIR